jgi:UDP-glucose 4-epimerase
VDGIPPSYYSRQKAEIELRLEHFESQNPDVRVVRFRQAPAFKRESAEDLRRLFGGPFFPDFLARPEFINIIPEIKGLRFQVVGYVSSKIHTTQNCVSGLGSRRGARHD